MFRSWNTPQVCDWLQQTNLGFQQEFSLHNITGAVLGELDYHTLLEMGVAKVADRFRILQAIRNLFRSETSRPAQTANKSELLQSLASAGLYSRDPYYDNGYKSTRAPIAATDTKVPVAIRKPLVIFPRSSSIARDEEDASSPFPKEQGTDVMDVPNVRNKCIRVHGVENQSHIIKIAGLEDPSDIRIKIGQKFNISNRFDLFVAHPTDPDSLLLVDDDLLLLICSSPEHPHRGAILLRKISQYQKDDRSLSKATKFFGELPVQKPQPKRRSRIKSKHSVVTGPLRTTSLDQTRKPTAKQQRSKLSAFFGERPPDELVADQLESFFPGLKGQRAGREIKSIVQSNLDVKNQNRMSMMLKRKTMMFEKQESLVSTHISTGTLSTAIPEDKQIVEIVEQPQHQLIKNWELGKLIGQGGFGSVYFALNLDNGVMMAVKQVKVPETLEPVPQLQKQMDALKREIELLSDLAHENIVQYLGFEMKAGEINVFLEYVSGGSVSSLLASCGQFTEVHTQSFTQQILCGLSYLHSRNLIHRDIKGANILIDSHSIAKITDFGISKKQGTAISRRAIRCISKELANVIPRHLELDGT